MGRIYVRSCRDYDQAASTELCAEHPVRIAFSFDEQRGLPEQLISSSGVDLISKYPGGDRTSRFSRRLRPKSRADFAFVFDDAQTYSADLDAITRRLLEELSRDWDLSFEVIHGFAHPLLTTAEIETLRLKYHGFTAKQIARIRACSPRTVEKHIENVYHKTGAQKLTPEMLRLMETCFYVLLPDTSWYTKLHDLGDNRPRTSP